MVVDKSEALFCRISTELAAQIGERFSAYSEHVDIRHKVIFGGVNQNPQVNALKKGVDLLVATPGRLLDLIGQGHIDLGHVEFFVLDEADQMLDMGFIRDIKKILDLLPRRRQNLLFSATMPKSIADLAGSFLNNAVKVDVSPKEITVDRIAQKIMFVRKSDKRRLLVEIIKREKVGKAIVFTRTKHGANRLVKQLGQSRIEAAAIHGNKSQSARTKALESFKNGKINVLVATDIASRGIDVDNITHVFNYDLPNEPESYVHRIGRTARAGKSGVAYGFCDDTESGYLVGIQNLIGFEIDVDESHDYHFKRAIPGPDQKPGKIKPTSSVKTVIQTVTKAIIQTEIKPYNSNKNNNQRSSKSGNTKNTKTRDNKKKNRDGKKKHKPNPSNKKKGQKNNVRKNPYARTRNRNLGKKNFDREESQHLFRCFNYLGRQVFSRDFRLFFLSDSSPSRYSFAHGKPQKQRS